MLRWDIPSYLGAVTLFSFTNVGAHNTQQCDGLQYNVSSDCRRKGAQMRPRDNKIVTLFMRYRTAVFLTYVAMKLFAHVTPIKFKV